MPSPLEDVSLIIKTFERQQALERLLDSIIARGYAECPILVADDSEEPYRGPILEQYQGLVDAYVTLPFDSGLSKGRNELLKRVETEYFVLNDDDFVYDERTDLGWMREQIELKDLELLGGGVYEPRTMDISRLSTLAKKGALRTFFRALREEGHELYERTLQGNHEKTVRFYGDIEVNDETVSLVSISYSSPLTFCDYTPNFFMADTQAIRNKVGGWDEDLKICEHWEFFYRAALNELRVATTEEVGVGHRPMQRGAYSHHRFSKEEECRRRGLNNHGLKKLILQGYTAMDLEDGS
jgi:GT2 family glycosyltransferase